MSESNGHHNGAAANGRRSDDGKVRERVRTGPTGESRDLFTDPVVGRLGGR